MIKNSLSLPIFQIRLCCSIICKYQKNVPVLWLHLLKFPCLSMLREWCPMWRKKKRKIIYRIHRRYFFFMRLLIFFTICNLLYKRVRMLPVGYCSFMRCKVRVKNYYKLLIHTLIYYFVTSQFTRIFLILREK